MTMYAVVVPEMIGPVVLKFASVEAALKFVVRRVVHMGQGLTVPGDEGASVWKQARKGWEKLA